MLRPEAAAALQKQVRGDRHADSSRVDSASLSARGRPGPVLASSNYAAAREENIMPGGAAAAATAPVVDASPVVPDGPNAGELFLQRVGGTIFSHRSLLI
jgi:hypothetical protein